MSSNRDPSRVGVGRGNKDAALVAAAGKDPELHKGVGKSTGTHYRKTPRKISASDAEIRDEILKLPRDKMRPGVQAGTIRAVDEFKSWQLLAAEQREAKYNYLRELKARLVIDQAVADAMNWTLEGLIMALSMDESFHATYHALRRTMAQAQKPEGRLTAQAPDGTGEFPWSESSRQRLIEHYVNTGSLFAAQKEVGCTPSQFNTEVANNGAFSHAYKVARRSARATLRIIAEDKAINGDERLLAQLLKESEEEGSTQLTDAQIEHRILGILAAIRSRIDPLGTLAAESGREAGTDGDADGGGEAQVA